MTALPWLLLCIPCHAYLTCLWLVQGNSSDMLRGDSSSLEADWEGSLLEGDCNSCMLV